jgi:hypothetical protein
MASPTKTPTSDAHERLGFIVSDRDEVGHRASVHIRGELCAITVVDHGRHLADLVDQGFVELRVELGDLTLCTSDGLDLWDDLQHRLTPLAGRLTLAGATGVVRRVLDVATRPELHFCPTVELAAA